MQLVRMLEPRPRSLGSKFVEALRAVQLSVRLSKAESLDAYLSFVPFGKNLEGVEAASWAYFGHGAKALTLGEIATLLERHRINHEVRSRKRRSASTDVHDPGMFGDSSQ